MSARGSRQKAQRRGIWSERLAAISLRLKGYRIIARNFKTKVGEIDIIAKKGEVIAIVEVKARRELDAAINSVSYESQRRIENAADYWLSKRKDASQLSLRFDIIAVLPWSWPIHIENAF